MSPVLFSYNWKFVHFDHLHPTLFLATPTSGNHKSNLFFYEWICIESIIDLKQHCVGSYYTVCCCCCCLGTSVVSDSVGPHRWQPTRLPRPWDSPGKNTGVGCHFLLQCVKVKSEREVAWSCPTHSDPMDCSLPGSSVHGLF